MAKFRFRMQRLLDHRRYLEKSAKDVWMLKRAERLAGEEELEQMRVKRRGLASETVMEFTQLVQQQHALSRMESLEKAFLAFPNLRFEVTATTIQPVAIAPHRVDLTIVSKHPERMAQCPCGEGVGAETLVEDSKGGFVVITL